MKTEYLIVDDFQMGKMRVLVLETAYKYGGFNEVVIDGCNYRFSPNSVRNWIIIESKGEFKGKNAKFICRKQKQ